MIYQKMDFKPSLIQFQPLKAFLINNKRRINQIINNLTNNFIRQSKDCKKIQKQLENYKCLQTTKSRRLFTKEEDEKIKELVGLYGDKNWTKIALFMEGRTSKQCRDRYSNYLVHDFFKGEWTIEEDRLLSQLYQEHGSRWSIIQKQFPNRSSNAIKNRWYYFLQNRNQIIYEKDTKENNNFQENNEDIFGIDTSFDFVKFENEEDIFSIINNDI